MVTILVVDDEPAVIKILQDALSYRGYDVMTASDGVHALERIDECLPSIIISDFRMPRLDGVALAHKLLMMNLRSVPFILMSATPPNPLPDVIAAALSKPFSLHDLYGTIDKFTRQTA